MMNLEDEDSGILLSYQIYNNEEVDEGIVKEKRLSESRGLGDPGVIKF
jgi:hypothetical protein